MNLLILFLSVVIGVLVVYILKPKKSITQLLLSFSGAYLLAITVTHLLPEVFENSTKNIGAFIILGLLIQLVMDYFSKGAEHGHIHVHGNKFPTILFVSLFLTKIITTPLVGLFKTLISEEDEKIDFIFSKPSGNSF